MKLLFNLQTNLKDLNILEVMMKGSNLKQFLFELRIVQSNPRRTLPKEEARKILDAHNIELKATKTTSIHPTSSDLQVILTLKTLPSVLRIKIIQKIMKIL